MTDLPLVAATPKRNPIVRLFASVWFGVILLFLILAYASVSSALPQVRGAVEMTEMEIFSHWVFVLLNALFCISLTVATVTRIRWNNVNAGAITVHVGLLMLAAGSFWYFASKVEGDVQLESPRIEIRTADGRQMRDAQVLAEKGQSWVRTMPAFGGRVDVEVLEASSTSPKSARVSVQLGRSAPEIVELGPANPSATVGSRLQVALVESPPATEFYQDDTAVLYHHKVGAPDDQWGAAEIDGLPHHRERYLDDGYVLKDSADRDVPSKRTKPEAKIAGLTIPTGWFEHWRLPIKLDTSDLPFDVEVTGYVPYVSAMQGTVHRGSTEGNPAVELELSDKSNSMRRWLLANDPASSLLETLVPFEFYWIKDTAERDDLFRPLAGPNELTIEVSDPPISKTIAIAQGQTIEIEGTSYKLTIKQLSPSWPLMTPGFENARSPMASVDVVSDEKSYNRTVIQRFPELSQDIDEQGVRHREGPYDPNLKLLYRTCATGRGVITAGPGIAPVVAIFDPDGGVKTYDMPVGQATNVAFRGFDLDLTLRSLYEHGTIIAEPVLEALETRRPGLGRQLSAIRLKLTGRGEHADWSESRWLMHSFYPHVDARVLNVETPWDNNQWELIFSRRAVDLGAKLYAGKLSVEFFPGRRGVESWRSDFTAVEDGDTAPIPSSVFTNSTTTVGRWTYFQSGAATDHWSYTILGVGNRHGILPMTMGCILITLGCIYAFYIKPVLIRRRLTRSRVAYAGGGAQRTESGKEPSKSPELVEV